MRTISSFKNGNNRAIRLPRDLDFEGVSWRSSRKGTASSCVPSGQPGARSRSWKKQNQTLWRSAGTLPPTTDALSYETVANEDLYARYLYLFIHHA